jgi:aminomethyltransferase
MHSNASENVKKTVLYYTHRSLSAKMAPFGGFDLPIQYEGILKEHATTREHASIFDTCHMEEFRFSGSNACADLEKILTCSVSTMKVGQCRYGFICNDQGGVIDDQILYRFAENKFFMVVNAATGEGDFQWIKEHITGNTVVTNISDITAKIDLQGPESLRILNQLIEEKIGDMKYYHFEHSYYKSATLLISRTGYTGELGFELYLPHDLAVSLWADLTACGAKPAGLGCRDTLRLEMGYPLYGHELGPDINPAQTTLTSAIATDKNFIGSAIVLDPAFAPRKLVGIILEDRRTTRSGDEIISPDHEKIGVVTSGSFSPSLQVAIALAYVKKEYATPGISLWVETKRQKIKATITELPFYNKGTCRKPLELFL